MAECDLSVERQNIEAKAQEMLQKSLKNVLNIFENILKSFRKSLSESFWPGFPDLVGHLGPSQLPEKCFQAQVTLRRARLQNAVCVPRTFSEASAAARREVQPTIQHQR